MWAASLRLSAQRALEKNAKGTSAGAAVVKLETLRILRSLGQLQKRDVTILREAVSLLEHEAQRDRLSVWH